MKIEVTIKISPESSDELNSTFRQKYEAFRAHVERLQTKGLLPLFPQMRWVLALGILPPPRLSVASQQRLGA